MIIDLEIREGLQRCLTVQLSDKYFRNAVSQQQSLLANDLELNNLKPDDICSSKEFTQKFDASVDESIINEVINLSFEQAVNQLQLRIVGDRFLKL